MSYVKPKQPVLQQGHSSARGLVRAYLACEGAGGVTRDYSLRGQHGTLTNMDLSAVWVGEPHGRAIDFQNVANDAGDDIILVPQIGAMPEGTLVFFVTIDALPASGNSYVFAHSDYTTGHRIYFGYTSAGKLMLQLGSGGEYHRTAGLAAGTYVLAAIWSGGVGKLYKNAIQQGTNTAYSGTPGSDAAYSAIGGWTLNGSTVNNDFDGRFHLGLIYSRVLVPSELAALYADPYAMFRPRWRWEMGPPAAVGGPYRVPAGQAWHTGVATGQTFVTGAAIGQTSNTG